jgi:hypothetical protein
MAEDFYIDDYGGEFYDSVAPIDFAPTFELLPQQETQFFDLSSFESEPLPFEPLPGEFESFELPVVNQFEPLPVFEQEPFFTQLPFTPLPEFVLEPLPPIDLFAETIQMETEQGFLPIEQPVILPDPLLPTLPFVPTFELFEPVDFFPLPFVEEQIPAPPTQEKLGPCDTPNGLPGPCPQGQYHPQADPCSCVPFPPAPTQQQTTQQPTTTAPKPSSPSPTPSPTPAPTQQQQACPTGYCKHPQTGQCMQIPVGYVRHPQTQVCTLATQQTTPPPGEADIFAELKKLPWWVWAGVAGAFLLGGRR